MVCSAPGEGRTPPRLLLQVPSPVKGGSLLTGSERSHGFQSILEGVLLPRLLYIFFFFFFAPNASLVDFRPHRQT